MDKYEKTVEQLSKALNVDENFDIARRCLEIGGRRATAFFADSLVSSQLTQDLFAFLLDDNCVGKIGKKTTAEDFLESSIPFMDSQCQTLIGEIVKDILTGKTALLLEGLDQAIMVDTKDYPLRSVGEPEKEKTLRGAKDGLTETVMQNVGMLRRRIRDHNFVAKGYTIGEKSQGDVILCYMKGIAKEEDISRMDQALKSVKIDSLTACEQTLVEKLCKRKKGLRFLSKLNPLPKARYTSRPDTICAHITEGKLVLMVDNSPTAIIFPVELLDLFQDMDDYYFPAFTGNYLRLVRFLNLLVIMFLSPIYLCFVENYMTTPAMIEFFVPKEEYYVPIFWQFMLLEFAIDGLKLASLNTPDALGNSLSVVGALLLGDLAIKCGWFVPQTVFVMVVLALANFTIPSIELGYAMKFFRIFMLIGVIAGGLVGWIITFVIGILALLITKDMTGRPYLYPIIPFDGKVLKKLVFRTFE